MFFLGHLFSTEDQRQWRFKFLQRNYGIREDKILFAPEELRTRDNRDLYFDKRQTEILYSTEELRDQRQ